MAAKSLAAGVDGGTGSPDNNPWRLTLFSLCETFGFSIKATRRKACSSTNLFHSPPLLIDSATSTVRVGDLLSDLPTPCLLLELSLAENSVEISKTTNGNEDPSDTLVAYLKTIYHPSRNQDHHAPNSSSHLLDGCLFVHTTVVDTTERDRHNQQVGSGKSLTICQIDASPSRMMGVSGSGDEEKEASCCDYYYLGIGLANHHVGGYYWARGMGMGASLPAHGIAVRNACVTEEEEDEHDHISITNTSTTCTMLGELYWKKRGPGHDAYETTEESSNSNDGKRSEWADFLAVGDTVQLVPCNVMAALLSAEQASSSYHFQRLLGVRRLGRPLGSDPIVEQIYERSGEGWVVVES